MIIRNNLNTSMSERLFSCGSSKRDSVLVVDVIELIQVIQGCGKLAPIQGIGAIIFLNSFHGRYSSLPINCSEYDGDGQVRDGISGSELRGLFQNNGYKSGEIMNILRFWENTARKHIPLGFGRLRCVSGCMSLPFLSSSPSLDMLSENHEGYCSMDMAHKKSVK
jgi:hypothetical protein